MIHCLLAPEWWEEIADGVYVLVGAILGVLSSLLLAWGAKRRGIHRLKKMLKIELLGIISETEEKMSSDEPVIPTSPIWSFIGQTSTLLELNEKDYKKVVATYGAILAFKSNENNIETRGEDNRKGFIDRIREINGSTDEKKNGQHN